MAARYSTSGIKKRRSYSIQEAAEVCGVSVGTIRNWVRDGLPALKETRPFLVEGSNLLSFLNGKKAKCRTKLSQSELFCTGCQAARQASEGLVEISNNNGSRAMIRAICPECEGIACRIISLNEIPHWTKLEGKAKGNSREDYTDLQTGT